MACSAWLTSPATDHTLRLAELERAIPQGATVLLDTSTLSAYFGAEPTSPVAVEVIDTLVHSGRNRALVSAVSAAELLVRPLRAGRRDVGSSIIEFLRMSPHIDVVSIDLTVAMTAAELRAREGMRMADALIAASGLDRSATIAVSDDNGWPDVLVHNESTMHVLALRSFLSAP